MEGFTPRRILVGTDFSEVSTWALRHAVMWAQRYQAHLTILHVQQLPWMMDDSQLGVYNLGELLEALQESATQQLADAIQRYVPAELPVASAIVPGMPASEIDAYAESGRADMVVLGTHGRGGFSRLLLGSVAERALRMAGRPTLIVRPHSSANDVGADSTAEQASGPPRPEPQAPAITHILCPVNYSEVARAAFEHACSVARTFGARLTVLFAVEEKHLTPEGMVRGEEELRSWLPPEPAVECQMQPVIRQGDAGEQVVTLAREAGVDLVVIGAQHRRFVDTTVLGVTTLRVTRHAPCPVLVVPRSEDGMGMKPLRHGGS